MRALNVPSKAPFKGQYYISISTCHMPVLWMSQYEIAPSNLHYVHFEVWHKRVPTTGHLNALPGVSVARLTKLNRSNKPAIHLFNVHIRNVTCQDGYLRYLSNRLIHKIPFGDSHIRYLSQPEIFAVPQRCRASRVISLSPVSIVRYTISPFRTDSLSLKWRRKITPESRSVICAMTLCQVS